jgi:hypothetical protein
MNWEESASKGVVAKFEILYRSCLVELKIKNHEKISVTIVGLPGQYLKEGPTEHEARLPIT